jgi:DNA-binding NarL/FixJ family response regulator
MSARPPAAILRPVGPRCLIVDDDARFCEVARTLLERDAIEVVGSAASAAEARSRVAELHPDVVLVDIDLGADSGFALARVLAREDDARLILISTHSEADFADLIAASPAVGFIAKSELSARAIRELAGRHAGPPADR